MKRARIAYRGVPVWGVVLDDNSVQIPDGTLVPEGKVHWLAPVTPGATIFALGLNYADHSRELGFKPPASPLVFLKGPNSLTGHRAPSPRPADGNQMHPECELVAIIGKPVRASGQARERPIADQSRPILRFNDVRIRSGPLCCSGACNPLKRAYPLLVGSLRSPRTDIILPPDIMASRPQLAWQIRQNVSPVPRPSPPVPPTFSKMEGRWRTGPIQAARFYWLAKT